MIVLNMLLCWYLFQIFFNKEVEYEREYLIASNTNPQYIYWKSKNEIFVSDTDSPFFFNLNTREKDMVDPCEECLLGFDTELLYCEYEHRKIQSEAEFSTKISIKNKDEEVLKEVEVFPTVVPIVCKKNIIILKSAYTFLEQKVYIYVDEKLTELNIPTSQKDLVKEIYSPDNTTKIVLDEFKNLWVYRKKNT